MHVLCSVARRSVTTAMVPLDVTLTHYQTSASPAPSSARETCTNNTASIFVRGWFRMGAFLPSSVLLVIYEQARKVLWGNFAK